MRKVCFALICLLLLTSCQYIKETQLTLPKDMNPKDLPEGRAFEDEYTIKFIQSTEEVMPGYYPFLANNGKYEMAFPKEGLTDGHAYRSKGNFESILFTDWEEERETSAVVDMKFYSYFNPGYIEPKQRSLSTSIGEELEFEKVTVEDQTYYIAAYQKDKKSDDSFEEFGYGAYIQKESEAGGIFVIYSLICRGNCEETKEADMQEAYDWILTIQFLDDDSAEAED